MNVLFFPRHAAAFFKMLAQATHLQSTLPLRSVVVIPAAGNDEWIAQCAAAGVRHIDCRAGQPLDPLQAVDNMLGRLPSPVREFLSRNRVSASLPFDLCRYLVAVRSLRRGLRYWRDILQKEKPAVVMMPGDRELQFVPPVLRAAADMNVPSVIAVAATPTNDGLAANRRGKVAHLVSSPDAPWMNRRIARTMPRQVDGTHWGPMLFSPGWLTLALKRMGMLSNNPWIQGGGNSRYILLDGERKRALYRDAGVPDLKLRVIGDITHDPLFSLWSDRASLRARLAGEYNFDSAKRIVAFAVPIYAEHDYASWTQHLAELDRFAAVLADAGAGVLLSPHPKSDPANYAFLTEKYGFPVSRRPLNEFLPGCDLLVCGSSSTQDWAVLCRMPAISLDYVGFNDRAYENVPGIRTVRTPGEFATALAELTAKPEQIGALNEGVARQLAMFDGRSGERLTAFMAELVGHPSAKAAHG